MAKYSKFNIIYILQKWMESVAGQTFMNYAYSWGASIVILGTLFKLTHLPGANIMLFIGMGTEVFVFFIAAFDRPFDKTADGKALATDSELAQQLAVANGEPIGDSPVVVGQPQTVVTGSGIIGGDVTAAEGSVVTGGGVSGGGIIGGPIVVGGGAAGDATVVGGGVSAVPQGEQTEGGVVAGNAGGPVVIGGPVGAPAPAVSAETAEAMEEATTTYIDRLNELNELLLKVSAQSERLTTDSEEMENLNRTLTGIARVYEMQLKSASQQMTTQDEINERYRQMAQQMADLNAIYARMIEAMTVNAPMAQVKG